MILLDTHIWVWWVSRPDRLQARHRELLELGADRVFGVSVISCWEVAKLVEYGRLELDRAVTAWIESALAEPGVSLCPSIRGATARVFQCPMMTEDSKIAAYPHVRLA